jgi:hypothetical protein
MLSGLILDLESGFSLYDNASKVSDECYGRIFVSS